MVDLELRQFGREFLTTRAGCCSFAVYLLQAYLCNTAREFDHRINHAADI
eukprot:COSAG02_NODE_6962_length_3261_cov_8.559140_1_plen_49_part_10